MIIKEKRFETSQRKLNTLKITKIKALNRLLVCLTRSWKCSPKMFLKILLQHDSDEGWESDQSIRIKGGNWAQGKTSVTQGIWLYIYPQFINDVSPKKIIAN